MAERSSANLVLTYGAWCTHLKLRRIRVDADAPHPILTHTLCRSAVYLIDQCSACHHDARVTTPQKTGKSKGKAATEGKDAVCPYCHTPLKVTQVTFCGTCARRIDKSEVQTRLAFDGQTVAVTGEQFTRWRALTPTDKEMRPVALVPSSHVGSYLKDEAYQLVPEKGSALSFAAWLQYLTRARQALIVHFCVATHFKMGAIYSVHVRGIPTLILHTLYAHDQIALKPFDLPTVSSQVVDLVDDLTSSLRLGREPDFSHPQRRAFHELFDAARDGGEAKWVVYGAVPHECDALSQQLAQALEEKKKKGKKTS